jgi:hypothetical protein
LNRGQHPKYIKNSKYSTTTKGMESN